MRNSTQRPAAYLMDLPPAYELKLEVSKALPGPVVQCPPACGSHAKGQSPAPCSATSQRISSAAGPPSAAGRAGAGAGGKANGGARRHTLPAGQAAACAPQRFCRLEESARECTQPAGAPVQQVRRRRRDGNGDVHLHLSHVGIFSSLCSLEHVSTSVLGLLVQCVS